MSPTGYLQFVRYDFLKYLYHHVLPCDKWIMSTEGPEEKTRDEQPGISKRRRNLLKATGTAASVSAFGSGIATALDPSNSVGQKMFIEIELKHKGAPPHTLVHSDDFPDYLLDQSNNTLHLTRFLTDEQFSIVDQNMAIVKADGELKSASDIVVSRRATQQIPVDSTRALRSEEPFSIPSVKSSIENGIAVIEVAGEQISVSPGKTGTIRLPTQTATIREQKQEFEQRLDPRTGKQKKHRVRGGLTDVTLRPTINIKNRGKVEVYDNRDAEKQCECNK